MREGKERNKGVIDEEREAGNVKGEGAKERKQGRWRCWRK